MTHKLSTTEKRFAILLFISFFIGICLLIYFTRNVSQQQIRSRKLGVFNTNQNSILNDKEFLNKISKSESISPIKNIINLESPSSSQIDANYWGEIANSISKYYDEFDTIIIIDDSNCIAYTAAALSLILENNNKPIIITNEDKNNIHNSLILASKVNRDILVCIDDKYYSPTKINHPINNQKSKPLGKVNDVLVNQYLSNSTFSNLNVLPIRNNSVMILKVFPGINDAHFPIGKSIRGIILETYDENNSKGLPPLFTNKLKDLADKGVYIIDAHEIGMTPECAFVKLNLLLTNVKLPLELSTEEKQNMIHQLMITPINGE